jgi:hypothetical protein
VARGELQETWTIWTKDLSNGTFRQPSMPR